MSASNCWAAGYYLEPAGSVWQTLIERWDGTSWAIVTSPSTSAAQTNFLNGVACLSASDCWAVGYYYSGGIAAQTLIERWDGTSWAIVSSPNISATQYNLLYGMTCASGLDCWAIGIYYVDPGVTKTLIEHYGLPFVQLNAVVSRKAHGSAGTFDINLPLSGTRGVECRSGGTNNNYTMVFTFLNPVTNCGAASTGSLSSGPNPNQCTVNLTGVTNAQYLRVTLTGAVDSTGATGNVSGTMGVLVGDVNANGVVTNADVSLVKAQVAAGGNVDLSNFRDDVNANGILSNADVSLTKAQVAAGAQLP
jgi:hypothetical protein